ncbi:MAG: 50S ribosomal protein L1 [Candidatus Aenigmarchaeota archaeon]|nr:50S ribosomal protein L1 [Candidatus Aenigmarchaeota archaeon]
MAEAKAVILESVKKAKAGSKKRKFVQSFDLSINLKNIDLKKPENRFTLEIPLPEGRGKELKIAFFADAYAKDAEKLVDTIITKAAMEEMARDKKRLKKLAGMHDFFMAETTLMAQIGKQLGTVLGPRGKIPKPVPPKTDLAKIIEAAKRNARVALKETPVVHVSVGTESMEDDKLARNVEAVYNAVVEKLPKGRASIRSVYVKLTMGTPVKVEGI